MIQRTKTALAPKPPMTLDVKPWDDEMAKLEQFIRSIHVHHLAWGFSKLVQ